MKLRRFGILWIGIMALTFTACFSSKSDNQSVKSEVTEITEETEKAAEETESVQEIKSTDEEVQEDSKPTYLDISLEEINTLVFASLIDYKVEGNEIIITGYHEGYEDEESEELHLLHNFTAYGEYNEKSRLGKFKLKKIVVTD